MYGRISTILFGTVRAQGGTSTSVMPNLTQVAPSALNSARSLQMINCLRDRFIYSEKRPRDILFRAVEEILCGRNTVARRLILSRLTREAANDARREAQRIGFEYSNWDTVSKAVTNAMLGAGVLLAGNGTSIPVGIAALGTPIVGLKEGYRDCTEAYLIEFLVRNLGDVRTRDHRALAHALFRQFDRSVPMEDLEDRVAILLATLDGRVTLRENGAYSVPSDTIQVL
jgi:hypothetical protein